MFRRKNQHQQGSDPIPHNSRGIGPELDMSQAFSRLAALCARGEHSEHELTQKMRQWGLSDEDQAAVMAKLTEGRYVDNRRFAQAFVADKVRYNKWGRRKVEQALWQKGITGDIAQEALDTISDQEYIDILRPMLKQRQRTIKAANDYELGRKLTQWALARGFSLDIVRQCIDNATSDYDDDEDILPPGCD